MVSEKFNIISPMRVKISNIRRTLSPPLLGVAKLTINCVDRKFYALDPSAGKSQAVQTVSSSNTVHISLTNIPTFIKASNPRSPDKTTFEELEELSPMPDISKPDEIELANHLVSVEKDDSENEGGFNRCPYTPELERQKGSTMV